MIKNSGPSSEYEKTKTTKIQHTPLTEEPLEEPYPSLFQSSPLDGSKRTRLSSCGPWSLRTCLSGSPGLC